MRLVDYAFIFGPVISAFLVALAAHIAARVALARIETRMDEQEKVQTARHASNEAKFENIEHAMGNGSFLSRREHQHLDDIISLRIDAVKVEVHAVKVVVDDVQRRVVHLEQNRRAGGVE